MTDSAQIPQENTIEPYSFSKDKLSKRLSYPLKRSLLDEAWHTHHVYDAVYSVRYLGHPNRAIVLDACFNPIVRGTPKTAGRNSLTLWAVPAEQRHAVETLIVNHALPMLCLWLAKTQAEGEGWRIFPHEIRFEIQDGNLHCSGDKPR